LRRVLDKKRRDVVSFENARKGARGAEASEIFGNIGKGRSGGLRVVARGKDPVGREACGSQAEVCVTKVTQIEAERKWRREPDGSQGLKW
jgi:hypothetical protein